MYEVTKASLTYPPLSKNIPLFSCIDRSEKRRKVAQYEDVRRALQVLYIDYESYFEELLARNGSKTYIS